MFVICLIILIWALVNGSTSSLIWTFGIIFVIGLIAQYPEMLFFICLFFFICLIIGALTNTEKALDDKEENNDTSDVKKIVSTEDKTEQITELKLKTKSKPNNISTINDYKPLQSIYKSNNYIKYPSKITSKYDDFDPESVLHRLGYKVGKTSLPKSKRRELLKSVIETGELSKMKSLMLLVVIFQCLKIERIFNMLLMIGKMI